MGIIERLFDKRGSVEDPSVPIGSAGIWDILGGGNSTDSGVSVGPKNAMNFTAVHACVKVIAEDIASLPLITYQRVGEGKKRADKHPAYTLLKDEPNSFMSPSLFWEAMLANILLWGNGYAAISRLGNGQPHEMFLLLADRTNAIRSRSGDLMYVTSLDGQQVMFPKEDILHIPGLTLNGIDGLSPIALARQAIGSGLAAEKFGAMLFSNGVRASGVLEYPGEMSDTAYERLKNSFSKAWTGLSNVTKPMILEEGAKWTQLSIPPNDAQFLETREFQLNEIARIYRVPPHMVGDLRRATFSNIEHQSISYVVHTLRPCLVRIEREIDRKLFTPRDRKKYFAEFLVDSLLRGDTLSRYKAHNLAINSGWTTRNEVRVIENMNPLDGLDEPLVPLNMVDATKDEPGDDDDGDTGTKNKDGSDLGYDLTAFRGLFGDAVNRLLKKESKAVKQAAKRMANKGDCAAFVEWLDKFYDDHREAVRQSLRPIVMTMLQLSVFSERSADECVGKLVTRHISISKGTLKSAFDGENLQNIEEIAYNCMKNWADRGEVYGKKAVSDVIGLIKNE